MSGRILPLLRVTSQSARSKAAAGCSQCIFCSYRVPFSSSSVWRRSYHFGEEYRTKNGKNLTPINRLSNAYSTESNTSTLSDTAATTISTTGAELSAGTESSTPRTSDIKENTTDEVTSSSVIIENSNETDTPTASTTPSEAYEQTNAEEYAEQELDFVPPAQCPGCGAPSQTSDPGKSGYYSLKRKREWVPRRVYKELDKSDKETSGTPTAPAETQIEVNTTTQSRQGEENLTLKVEEEEDEQEALFKAKIPETGKYGREYGAGDAYEEPEPYDELTAEEQEVIEAESEVDQENSMQEGKENTGGEVLEDEKKPPEDPREIELRKRFFAEQHRLKPPLCGRCHSLMHHSKGAPMEPPTFAMVTQPIAESRFPNVYIYHVIDAADFPLSVLPSLRRNILRHLPKTLSVGRNITFSVIVTRADLLMPKENMVSSLMTYLRTVLKEALPEFTKIGDIRVVSAKNTWTTERIKKEIRGRKGSVFLIGRTNVGKSRLFESIYPRNNQISKKGSSGWGKGDGVERGGFNYDELAEQPAKDSSKNGGTGTGESMLSVIGRSKGYHFVEMPTVNEVPGTTAGAIRIPFSNGKGELVDLPGLQRGKLLEFVRDECVRDTVMTGRIIPEQYVLKPGQSLLLGGLIRISAVTQKVTLLAYPFLTMPAHVTNHERAVELLNQPEPEKVHKPVLWSKPLIGESISSAGTFTLGWDVTQRRDARLKHYSAAEMEKIPYKIYSTDILVEGCGWVELVAEVLKWKDPPVVEVWSPLGKSIGSRPPMGAQALCKKKKKASPGSRPKRSMKGRAKEARRIAREQNVPEFWKEIQKIARDAREKRQQAE